MQLHDAPIGSDMGRVETVRRGDVTEQYGDDQADGLVWRAQIWGLGPKPLDLHDNQMCSKTNTTTGSSPIVGRLVEYE